MGCWLQIQNLKKTQVCCLGSVSQFCLCFLKHFSNKFLEIWEFVKPCCLQLSNHLCTKTWWISAQRKEQPEGTLLFPTFSIKKLINWERSKGWGSNALFVAGMTNGRVFSLLIKPKCSHMHVPFFPCQKTHFNLKASFSSSTPVCPRAVRISPLWRSSLVGKILYIIDLCIA